MKNNSLYYVAAFVFLLFLVGAIHYFLSVPQTEVVPEDQTQNEEATTSEPAPETEPMSDAEWVLSPVATSGTQFSYPRELPTTYVSAVDWPPVVELTAGEYVCAATGDVDRPEQREERTVDGKSYCRTLTAEGAAGSTYTTYHYTTAQGDFLVTVSFTLRTPQCLNYDEPNQSACIAEQASFDADALTDRIAASLRML